jgi:hypothetical protein
MRLAPMISEATRGSWRMGIQLEEAVSSRHV